jgi:nicotinamidase/pyrazinamidase
MKEKNYLIVVDVQKDFVDGVLGTPEAVAMIPYLVKKIKNFNGELMFTQDTHDKSYLSTIEGKKLPVLHCMKNTPGWNFAAAILPYTKGKKIFQKPTFGSEKLVNYIKKQHQTSPIQSIEVVGICTDICVISNVMMLKAALPNVVIKVDSKACAGVTPLSHQRALEAMASVHIDIQK